jgi:hypothetical protein
MTTALMNLAFFRFEFALDHPWLTAVGMLGLTAVYAALYPRTR